MQVQVFFCLCIHGGFGLLRCVHWLSQNGGVHYVSVWCGGGFVYGGAIIGKLVSYFVANNSNVCSKFLNDNCMFGPYY